MIGVPQLVGEIKQLPIMGRELGGMKATGNAGGDHPELLAEATELLGELGAGVGLGHGAGESGVEEVEVSGEGEAVGGAIKEALEEADLVGLGPYAVELERRRLPGVSAVAVFVGDISSGITVAVGRDGGFRVRVRVRVRVRIFPFDGELARGGLNGKVRLGIGDWGGVHS